MSSIFQAITRPADDILEAGSTLFSSGTRAVHPGRRIRLIDRTTDEAAEPLIPRSHNNTNGAAAARRQVQIREARQLLGEEPNAVAIARKSEAADEPEVPVSVDRRDHGDGPSSSAEQADSQDPTMALTLNATEVTSDESAPLLQHGEDDGYGEPAEAIHRRKYSRRTCTMTLERTVLKIISCLFFCCPTSLDGVDEDGEYIIGDEGDILPIIPSRFTRRGYERLKEEHKVDNVVSAAGNGIFSADPNIAYDILYENQRGFFMFGAPLFSSQSLLQFDPSAWVDADFRYSPFDILSTPVPDPSWEWIWRTWYIDMTYDVDDQGWSYSIGFSSKAWHGAHVWFHSFVRRRRWIRKRRRVNNLEDSVEYPNNPGIPDRIKSKKAYSIVEGTPLNYFSIESSSVKAREKHEQIRLANRHQRSLSAVAEDSSKPKTLDEENKSMDLWFSDDEEGDEASIEKIFTIGGLMRKLKKLRLDRQKIDAIEQFVCSSRDDIVLLAPLMNEIVSYLIFQQSRRELLRSLLFYYTQVRSRSRFMRTGLEEKEDPEANSHAKSHAHHATLDLESMTVKELSLRRRALHKAILIARKEVMKLDFYSDRKMSSKEYAKADLLNDSFASSLSTPTSSSAYKSALLIQDRILEESLEEVENEDMLEEAEEEDDDELKGEQDIDNGEGPEVSQETNAHVSGSDGDASTITLHSDGSLIGKGKIPEYKLLGDSPTDTKPQTNETKDPKEEARESMVSAVRNKVIDFVSRT
ncbi:uncharacterized protein V2V93DRAFT_343562 [Kockiozyma suomiensis]|uniref:uncharacterized protein n=1 Tax=Kockiozyma suomiensis TaxID=1337062 RepID=UPI0033438003